jgi:hypothetical protein
MKTILKYIAVVSMLFCGTTANADIKDGKFGPGQMFDVQYNWNGTTLNASSFTYIYSKDGQLSSTDYSNITSNNQYISFFDSTTNPGEYGLAVYNNDGSVSRVLHDRGTITALGAEAIFYLGSGFYGTVIPTQQGYAIGASASFTAMDTSVDSNDLAAYNGGSTTPLAAGETASSAPPAPTPVYLSSITTVQQAQRTAAFAVTTGNNIELAIIGNSNDVDIDQISDGNYLMMQITGDSNIADITQSGTNLDRNFADIDVNGSTNSLTFVQSGNSNKTSFLDIDGSFGTFDITQTGSGEHYLNFSSLGNNADVTILQEGLGNHSATIGLTNSGGDWDFTLTQSGDVDQLYSLEHNLSDNTVVTGDCYSGTCTMVINQQ